MVLLAFDDVVARQAADRLCGWLWMSLEAGGYSWVLYGCRMGVVGVPKGEYQGGEGRRGKRCPVARICRGRCGLASFRKE